MNSQRKILTLSSEGIDLSKILSWGKQSDPFILLNSNSDEQLQTDKYSSFDLMFAVGKIGGIVDKNLFSGIKSFHTSKSDWLFGYISYDVKNQVENLQSSNTDGVLALDYDFFCPVLVFQIQGKVLNVHYHPEISAEDQVRKKVEELKSQLPEKKSTIKIDGIKSRVTKEEYIDKVNRIKKHIHRGDIYEMNYCIEFFSENATVYPPTVYIDLNSRSPMPFSAYFKIKNHYLMCASPERFIAKRGNKIISQPIKGTAKRGSTEQEDKSIIESLRNDPKEQSENVMIVDLVRNDLSRTASRGSVIVEELFGVKTFRQLHQLVSTVTSGLKDDVHFTDAIRKAFPMGSMTGAPKIRAMELIEEFESTKRGIFSGTVGYVTPQGDFDFNVVIRSILYNDENRYLSFMAGSAITAGASPEKEYEECLLKAESMKRVLGGSQKPEVGG